MVPDWQSRMFDALPPSPCLLLEEAVKEELPPKGGSHTLPSGRN
jgi:hypothetical protein